MRKLIATLLLATSVFAQTSTPLVETMEVRVVSIDVVVTDSRGRRVTGLTKDDFELLVGKKPHPITHFSEIGDEPAAPQIALTAETQAAAPAAAAAAPVRRGNTILFFIDQSSLDPRRQHAVFEELRKFTTDVMRPGDRAMVAAWNRGLKTAQAFTDSPDEIRRALDRMQKNAAGLSLKQSRREVERQVLIEIERALAEGGPDAMRRAYGRSVGHATTYSEEIYAHTRTLMLSLASMLSAFAAPEDKKALVFVGDFLPSRAGSEMRQYVEDAFRPYNVSQDGPSQQLQPMSTAGWLDRVIRAANAGGITAYMISGGGLQQETTDVTEADAMVSSTAGTLIESETRRSFAAAAEATGGLAFVGGDPAKALAQVADDFRSYYSIGFRPTDAREGRPRNIVVRVKKPGHTVRARQNYLLRSVSEDMADRVVASLYDTTPPGEIGVRLASAKAVASGRSEMRLPVQVYVQGENVTLIPQGDTLAGELTVFVCAGNAQQGASKVLRHTQRLKIPARDEARFRASHLTFAFDVIITRKGVSTIAAGVLDGVSGSYGLTKAAVQSSRPQ